MNFHCLDRIVCYIGKKMAKLLPCFNCRHSSMSSFNIQKVKIKLSVYRPWRPLWLQAVEAPTFSDIQLIDGGKFVSPTRRPLFTPKGRFLVLISVRV
jgi:hypothetical protein